MKRLALAVLLAVGLVAAPGVGHANDYRPVRAWEVHHAERKLIRWTNKVRVEHGERALRRSRLIHWVAIEHTREMVHRDRLFHSPGPVCWTWGENIGVTGANAWSLQKAFMRSPEHRANILRRGYRTIGVGAMRVHGELWVTLEFCGPR